MFVRVRVRISVCCAECYGVMRVCVHDSHPHIVAVGPSLCSNTFRSISTTVIIAAISIVQHLTDNGERTTLYTIKKMDT